jgi:uncharacterized protein
VVKLDRRVVSVWRCSILIWGGIGLLLVLVALWFFLLRDRCWMLTAATAAVGVVIVAALAAVAPEAMWRHWSYEIGDQSLELSHGVLFREHGIIPWSRVQHVDVKHGPLDRRFGLAQLKVHTASAASDAELPGLDKDEAERLRLDILERYRSAQG